MLFGTCILTKKATPRYSNRIEAMMSGLHQAANTRPFPRETCARRLKGLLMKRVIATTSSKNSHQGMSASKLRPFDPGLQSCHEVHRRSERRQCRAKQEYKTREPTCLRTGLGHLPDLRQPSKLSWAVHAPPRSCFGPRMLPQHRISKTHEQGAFYNNKRESPPLHGRIYRLCSRITFYN